MDQPQTHSKMNRQQVALHGLQAEFMENAPTDIWVELPGGTHEGLRIPDYKDEAGNAFISCWFARPKDEH